MEVAMDLSQDRLHNETVDFRIWKTKLFLCFGVEDIKIFETRKLTKKFVSNEW